MTRWLDSLPQLKAFTIFGLLVLLTLVVTWQAEQYGYDRGLQRLHQAGENRLLFHISGLRRNLNRTRAMPFALAQNTEVIQLLEQPATQDSYPVDRFLEQINQVAGTRRWEVLDRQARVVASSDWREGRGVAGQQYPGAQFFEQALQGERGGYFEARGENGLPVYLLSAPIYGGSGLVGVALVTLDLGRLEEGWTAADETVLVSDSDALVFLTNRDDWRYQVLPLEGRSIQIGTQRGNELRGAQRTLGDGTRVVLLDSVVGPGLLMQSVWLDDLNWQVHLLTDLRPLLRSQRSLVLFCLGGGLALCLLTLLLRERLLKNRLHAEADALRLRNEAQQRAIISSTQVGLITLDQHGQVRSINPEAMAQFGVRGELIVGRPVAELLDHNVGSESLVRFFDDLQHERVSRPVKAVEGRAIRGDGSGFPALLSINPLAWDDGDGYLVTVVDISRRKRAEQALQRANDALEQRVQERTAALREAQQELIQQSKLASLGTMSAAIAHELNQPLTAIQTSLFSTRLLLQRGDEAQVERQLERIASMTERMATISGQLKVFAHKRVDRFEPVSARAVLTQVLEMMADRLRTAAIEVLWQGEPELTLYADQPRVEQVLVNLIRNALDAMSMPDGGQLQIELSTDSDRGCIAICDQGPGLSEEVLEHLFDPFFTTKEVGEGLGLGLSISYGIVRDLDGEIRASNRPQGGACFRVYLPLYKEQTELKGIEQ